MHKALDVRLWFMYNCPKVLQTPPRSSDTNVIENLWPHLESQLKKPIIRKERPRSCYYGRVD